MVDAILKALISFCVAGLCGAIVWAVKKLTSDTLKDKMTEAVENGIKPIQEELTVLSTTYSSDMKIIKKTLLDDVRQTLKQIHDDAMEADYISEHMYYVFQQLAQDYTRKDMLNGNSFVQDYWDELAVLNQKSRKQDLKK